MTGRLLEKMTVKHRVVRDDGSISRKLLEGTERLGRQGRVGHHLVGDARQSHDLGRYLAFRTYKRVERVDDHTTAQARRGYLDDLARPEVEPRLLRVHHDDVVFEQAEVALGRALSKRRVPSTHVGVSSRGNDGLEGRVHGA